MFESSHPDLPAEATSRREGGLFLFQLMNSLNSAMKKYKCIFFDLDHTLWDYETNSREALFDLYGAYGLHERGVTAFNDFCVKFKEVNISLWDKYDRGLITSDVIRKERFKLIFESFNICDDEFCDSISTEYLATCPHKSNVMPMAVETLEYLSKSYRLTIITNGFDEIQHLKLAAGKIDHFFDHLITSQRAGHKKPAREIFEFALQLNGIAAYEAIMIGDNPITDIGGARNANVDAILFNPEQVQYEGEISRQIYALDELRQLL
jgi:YjjG family noncanonical pyrimidine nucleotidase